MTMTSEVLKVATDVSAADVAVPAGFKEIFVPACPQDVAEIYQKIWNNVMK